MRSAAERDVGFMQTTKPQISGKAAITLWCGPKRSLSRQPRERGEPITNNADFANAVAADNGLTKADASKVVDSVFAAITGAAAKGEEMSLNGFG